MTTHGAPSTLDPTEIDAAVRTERLAIADLVAGLDGDQLATPSLCTAWTVRDVLAHLNTTTRLSVSKLLVAAVRARGSFDRMEVQMAAGRAAAYSTGELVAQLRESASSSRRFPGSGPMDPLMDLVVHAQDIARPLGVAYASPPKVVAACLAFVADNTWMGGPKRLEGLRIVSTDTGWARGDGEEVRGPDVDLLLAVSGRSAGLGALTGPGLERLTDQL